MRPGAFLADADASSDVTFSGSATNTHTSGTGRVVQITGTGGPTTPAPILGGVQKLPDAKRGLLAAVYVD